MRKINPKIVVLVLIFVMASFLSIYKLDTTYGFFGDQGRDLLVVSSWIRSGDLPLVGPTTSFGNSHTGPIFYYMLAPSLLLFQFHPLGAVYLMVALGLLTVFVTYKLVLFYSDFLTAAVTSFLVAISPIAIFLSRGSWNPNPQPLFLILLLYALILYFATNRYLYLFLTFLTLGAGIQLHYTFVVNIISSFLILLIFKPKSFFDYRCWGSALLGFTIPLFPFLYGQALTNFEDLKIFKIALDQSVSARTFFQQRELIDRFNFPFTVYFQPDYLPYFLKPFAYLSYLVITWLMVSTARSSSTTKRASTILLIFFFSGEIISALMKINFYQHYYQEFSLIVLLMVGLVSSQLLKSAPTKVAGVALLAIFAIWSIFNLPATFTIPRSPQAVFQISDLIIKDARVNGKNNFGIFAISPTTSHEGYEYRYLIEKAGYKTYSSQSAEEADYLIVEAVNNKEVDLKLIASGPQLTKVAKLSFGDSGQVIKYAEIYRVNKDR